jgi:hypothetical protein
MLAELRARQAATTAAPTTAAPGLASQACMRFPNLC